ncbi:MAG: 30S ribosomal protein S9 [Methanosarcinales archaeon Met12]|nr:MAG: 30S ribosomal protein S9 [Methanosarcinales archaeon Met12]
MVKIVNESGKRKTAIARVVIKKGSGQVRINKKLLENIEPKLARLKITEPLTIASDLVNEIDVEVNARGGGVIGQADAVRTAIARGLVKWTDSSSLRDAFLKYDRNLLVSDARQKERKKFGGRGARARQQKSYR